MTTTTNTQMLVCTHCRQVNRLPTGKALTVSKCGKCGHPLATSMPVDVDSELFNKLRGRDSGPFIVDVWAPWCGPCRMMAPDFEAAANMMRDKVRFFKLNSDQNQPAAASLGIRGIPTLLAYDKGKLVAQQAGALRGAALTQWIEAQLKTA